MKQRSWAEAVQWLQLYSELRDQLMNSLEQADLAFTLPGANPSLGQHCLLIGEIQHSYLVSFQTYQQNFEFRQPDSSLANDLDGLKRWYSQLDKDMFSLLEKLPEETVEGQTIDRGHDFVVDFRTQLDIYREALIIFYGKVSVYLKAMGKELPGRWAHWIE